MVEDQSGAELGERLSSEIQALENSVGAGEDLVEVEHLERIQRIIAEMERVVSGNASR